MTDRPAVLIMQRHLAPLTAFLETAYTVYRFWEGPPIEARADIRALVVAGEYELDKTLIERLPNLQLIACFTSGYDRIDVAWCRKRGLAVSHAPGVNHEDVADHAIGLISKEVIAALGSNGLLVNVARGQLIDEEALIEALKSGVLGQAALDVFTHEPTDAERWEYAPNTVLTPHTAGATTEAVQGMVMLLMQNLAAAFNGEPLKTPVQ